MEYQFKIQIKGLSKPPVWRKVIVPANFTFLQFHEVIQAAFGWENCHLFEFRDREYQSSIRIAMPYEDDCDPCVRAKDASEVTLFQLFEDGIRKLVYIYDFGDNWVHEITLETDSDEKSRKAFCLSGKGSCPPEDCGGAPGYEGMKHIFQTMPDSEAADEFRNWLGFEEDEVWDANGFDLEEVNADLKQI